MKRVLMLAMLLMLAAVGAVGCSDADTVSDNISKDADHFQVYRKIVFFNGITDKYLLEIDGYCSLGNYDSPKRLSVTCDEGHGKYRKHFLGLSDNVSYFVQQVDSSGVSRDHYKVVFKPETVIPDVDLQ